MICADTGDDGMNDETTESGFDIQGIKDFIVARDRQHNRFFVGRTDTIRRIADCLSLVSVRSKHKGATGHPAEGLMQLVQGAPGVGKTSLLDELTARYMARLASGDAAHKVIPIVISNTKRLSVMQVSQQLQEGMTRVLDRVGNEEVRVLVRDVLSIVQDINLFGLRLGKPNTVEPASPRLPEDCTILLMIDEIQTVPGGPDDEPAHILQHLEAGSNGPAILPLLAGLANSQHVLKKLGLSRQADDSITRLKPLTLDEIASATQKFITAFGIQATPAAQKLWERTLYRWSKGWSKHLQNGLSVLGTQLLATNGNLNAVDVLAAQRMAVAKRIGYYWTRMEEWPEAPELIGHVMAGIGRDPVTLTQITASIKAAWQKGDWKDIDPPTWTAMLRDGLIDIDQIDGRGITYTCPIPSLRSFAVLCTAPPLHGTVLDGKLDMVRAILQTDADVNGHDAWGRTALHIAAQDSWPELVTELLEAGASLEAPDKWYRTPLHLAAHDNAEQSLAALLAAGADVHAGDERNETLSCPDEEQPWYVSVF